MIYTKEEEGYIALFICYLVGRQPHTYSRYWFSELAKWLVGTDGEERSWELTSEHAPDMCGRCLACFGLTIGGRLRDGCFICHCREDTNIWEIPYIQDILSLGYEPVELMFSKALYIWSLNRSNQQKET